ncbi:MAG: dethiobiotin synthase [Zoogloeaceae bacterium]|nr:dethiobiotin synthase [Zoogloeaceae bacterium]
MSSRAFFVTGTDTEVGKTFTTCALIHATRVLGLSAVGMKPVAAGADEVDGRAINDDVAALIAASSVIRPEREVNPYLLRAPVAPHIAALEDGIQLSPIAIFTALKNLRAAADVVFVEGVGGFRVPLGPAYDSADLARDLGLPVILVVGMRLGCLSHALLTAEAIDRRGLSLAGWVANQIDPAMLRFQENREALASRIGAPLLGTLAHQAAPLPDAREAAGQLNVATLLA